MLLSAGSLAALLFLEYNLTCHKYPSYISPCTCRPHPRRPWRRGPSWWSAGARRSGRSSRGHTSAAEAQTRSDDKDWIESKINHEKNSENELDTWRWPPRPGRDWRGMCRWWGWPARRPDTGVSACGISPPGDSWSGAAWRPGKPQDRRSVRALRAEG